LFQLRAERAIAGEYDRCVVAAAAQQRHGAQQNVEAFHFIVRGHAQDVRFCPVLLVVRSGKVPEVNAVVHRHGSLPRCRKVGENLFKVGGGGSG
jgi:hypothetical protein